MTADAFLRRVHRVIAVLFLLAIPPAGFASARGGNPVLLVYVPLLPLFGLTLTGIWLLVRPWVQRLRRRESSSGRAEVNANL